jgi:cation diffusion facilitator CzcD-associated flavoprotein CzcO
LKEYADHFNLWPEISLSTSVTSIRRGQAGGHVIHYRGPDGVDMTWECDAVAVCTGLHVTPNIPDVPGIDKVKIVKHSSQFKKREEFPHGSQVVVLGTGETGMDIAHLAVTSPTKRVVLCHRQGFLGAPKVRSSKTILKTKTDYICRKSLTPFCSLVWETSPTPTLRNCPLMSAGKLLYLIHTYLLS